MTPTDIQNLINLLLTGGQNTALQFRNLLTAMLQYIESIDQTTINSVTGNLVDNTDPDNPIIDAGVSSDPNNGIILGLDSLPFYPALSGNLVDNSVFPNIVIDAKLSQDVNNVLQLGTDQLPFYETPTLEDVYNKDNVVNSSRVSIDANNFAIGNDAGLNNTGNNTTFIGNSAGLDQIGNDVIGIGVQAANENEGDNVIALGITAGRFNRINNSFIIGPNELPKFNNLAAAQAAITVANGASANNNYLFLDASDNTVKVIIPS